MSDIRTDHIQRFNDAARGIAAALGSGWKVSRPASNDYPSGLIISDGTRDLHLYLSNGSDKVDLSGIYPDRNDSVTLYENGERVERRRIGFSISKPAARIAGDIQRRFLPDYDRVRAMVVQRVEANQSAAAHQSAALLSMATALKVERRGDSAQLSTPFSATDRVGYGDFRANHDGTSWEISLRSVPASVAQQIAEIMAANRD